MGKFNRVFQIGFDIAQGEDVSDSEIESLYNALEEHINNFHYPNGDRVNFQSVGMFNCIDMSHAYGEAEINDLNN